MNSIFLNLRRKLLFSFGALFATSLIIIELMSLYGIPFTRFHGRYSIQKAEVLKNLENSADAKKQLLQIWLNERRADVEHFANDDTLRQTVERINLLLSKEDKNSNAFRLKLASSKEWQRLTRRLNEISRSYPDTAIDIISAKNNIVIASSRVVHVGENRLGDHGYLDVVNPLYDEAIRTAIDKSGAYRLHISRSISGLGSHANETIAVVTINTDLDAILRPMVNTAMSYGKTGETILVNSEGQSLTSLRLPRPDGNFLKPLSDQISMQPVDLALAGGEGITTARDYRNVPVLAAYRHLRISADVAWGMIVKIDEKEAFSKLRETVYFNASLGITGCMLVMLMTHLLSIRLTRPIDLLHQAAKKVQGGDLTVRAEVRSKDEVGVLAASFNDMVTQIQRWHEELEAQVRSRTEQLEASNYIFLAEMEERKRAVEALLQSETRFRQLLENIHLVAITLDCSGNITFCNQFLLNLTGWQREEVLGINWFDHFIAQDISTTLREMFSKGMEDGSLPSHFENSIVTRNGKSRNIVWDNTILHNPDGSIYGIASIGVDVTEHRNLEEQLRQSQKMDAIGRLAGGIAHDFNNMLGVILGYSELLMLEAPKDSKLRQRISEISKAAQSSSKITQQLLAFSRKEVITPKIVNMNFIVLETEKTLGRLIGEDIKLTFKPATDLWPVKVDPSQIDQILINLAVNARDAMPDGGSLTIETANIKLDEMFVQQNIDARPGDFVRISVSDTGIGMDNETRKHIFEPFYTTKEVGKGTGLGLATIYGIVTQNKGFINVYSEPGVGSTFTVYLPRSEESGQEDSIKANAAPTGSGTIMVVEDDPVLLAMTTEMLKQIGYSVISSPAPEQAISICGDAELKIDMIITDVIMPSINGKQMIKQIARIRPDIKVLYISGYTSEIIAQKGVLDEGMHFLMKPFSMRDLDEKIKDVLNNGRR